MCVCGCNAEIQSSTWMVEPALKQDCLPPDLLALQKKKKKFVGMVQKNVGWLGFPMEFGS